jgi:transcription termination factor Rho
MGTRALIVSPPRAGKTMLLEAMAQGIRKSHPDVRVIILLVDERPEEVTNFKRSVDAEVFASSNDMDGSAHIRIVELTMTHVRLELECGNHIALLVDSLTRMARAFNLNTPGRGRVMSGGVEAGALETPRRFFGLARTIENGGSITIAASALVDTGSRMDDLIFEEFKGTGNSEIVLDRDLANQRIWPAININESGTRKEELLLHPMEMKFARNLRRELSGQQPGHAVEQLKKIFAKYPTNEELVMSTR